MWLRFPTKAGEDFVGKDPKKHHDAEEHLKATIRAALADADSQKLLNGKTLHGKFLSYEAENGLEGTTWAELDSMNHAAWDLLATEIAEALAANGRELAQAKHAIEEAKGCLDVGNVDLALKRLEDINYGE